MVTLTEPVACEWLHDRATQVETGQCIVEIGVFEGGSLAHLCDGAHDDVPVFGVDPFGLPGVYDYNDRLRERYGRDTYAVAAAAAPSAHLIRDFSVSAAAHWAGRPIGLLFIDGDHADTASDVIAWWPHLAPGAWVAFDDYEPRCPAVVRAADVFASTQPAGQVEVVGNRLAVVRTS